MQACSRWLWPAALWSLSVSYTHLEYLNERGGKLTSRETVHFISQILKALEHAHANGVVPRAIKPQNIMLRDNGQLRMMDFGIDVYKRQGMTATEYGALSVPTRTGMDGFFLCALQKTR